MTEESIESIISAGGGADPAEQAEADSAHNRGVLQLSIGGVLANLAAPDPQWGGGSAVLLGASMGTCLLAMAARIGALGIRQDKFAAPELNAEELEQLGDELAARAEELADWAAKDGELYGRVVAAQRLPKEQPELRNAAILKALRGAIEGPLWISERIVDILRRAESLAANCKKSNYSDVVSGVQMLLQGIRGAILNVKQNCGQRECFAKAKKHADELGEAAEKAAQIVLQRCC
ncbi:MAG: cyclodeaminase/cyclohydrolase family protein [bacterium]|nr:cyclodeaminase/cyclohydrolase family protein [bacterium]